MTTTKHSFHLLFGVTLFCALATIISSMAGTPTQYIDFQKRDVRTGNQARMPARDNGDGTITIYVIAVLDTPTPTSTSTPTPTSTPTATATAP